MSGRAGFFFLAIPLLAIMALTAPALASGPLHLKYPVVMVHGIFARGEHAYFRGVEQRFRALGVPVSFPRLGFSNGVGDRAARLADHIRTTWPAGKVNVIAHSIGGLAAREAIARLGLADRVASLTTVSTPHRGTPVADWVVHAFGGGVIEELCQAAGVSADAMRDLTSASCAAFNARTPDAPGVAYFSLGGSQVWYRIAAPLQPFSLLIRLHARVRAGLALEPVDRESLAHETWGAAALAELDREAREVAVSGPTSDDREAWRDARGANDGVVPLTSTPWGASWGALDMDHLDEIGWGTNGAQSADLYEWIARSLADRGY